MHGLNAIYTRNRVNLYRQLSVPVIRLTKPEWAHLTFMLRQLLKAYDAQQSISRWGNCWDNAVAKSFFATLKKQAVHGERFNNREQENSLSLSILKVTTIVFAGIQRSAGLARLTLKTRPYSLSRLMQTIYV